MKPQNLIILILVFAISLQLVAAKTPQFVGKDFLIVSDRWEYTQKSGQVCYTAEYINPEGISQKKSSTVDTFLKGFENDAKILEKSVKNENLTKKKSVVFTIDSKDKKDENKTRKQTQTFCISYNLPLDYSKKFDIVVGEDVLDPLVNVSNPYNQTCSLTDVVWQNQTASFSADQLIYTALHTLHHPNPVYITKVDYGISCTAGVAPTYKIVTTYLDSTTLDSGDIAYTAADCPDFPLNSIKTYTLPLPSKKVSFMQYFGKSDTLGSNIYMVPTVDYVKCSPFFNDSYFFSSFLISNITILNTSEGCSRTQPNIRYSNDSVNYATFPISNMTATPTVSTVYLSINQTNCSWVYFSLTPSNITYLNIYIHDSNNNPIYQNVTITLLSQNGSTYLSQITNLSNITIVGIKADDYMVRVSSSGYFPSEYYKTVTLNYNQSMDVYLTSLTSTALTNIKIQNPYGFYVDNATLTVSAFLGGSWQTVSQRNTDSTGSAVFYLNIGEMYRVLVDKTGYITQQGTITPSSASYDVLLIIYQNLTINVSTPLPCVSIYSYYPTNLEVSASLFNFSLQIASPTGLLLYYGIYHNQSNYTNISTSTGGQIFLQQNLTTQSSTLYNISYFFKCGGYKLFEQNITYNVGVVATNTSSSIIISSTSADFSFLWKVLIILGTIIVALLISWELGLPQATYSIVTFLVLCFYTFYPMTWIPIFFTIVAGVVLIGSLFATTHQGETYG